MLRAWQVKKVIRNKCEIGQEKEREPNAVAGKLLLCKFADTFVECIENVIGRLHNGDGWDAFEFWVQPGHIFRQEIVQLRSKFGARRSTPDHDYTGE